MRRVPIVLIAGLSLTALLLGRVLTDAPITVAGTNEVAAKQGIDDTPGDFEICQAGGSVPSGTSAVRVSLSANVGPTVTVRFLVAGHVVDEGSRPAGWGIAETVSVPIRRVAVTLHRAVVCTSVAAAIEAVQINGSEKVTRGGEGQTEHTVALRLEYLREGHESWLSLATSVAQHLGLGRSPSGAWVAAVPLALMIAVIALVSWLTLATLR